MITVDALLTSRTIADRMGQGGGDDGMLGKGNQPPLPHEMPRVFHEAHLLAETMTATATIDSGHGRLEQRRLTASSALVGYRDWPGLAQVFQLERGVLMKKSGQQRHAVV